MAIPGFKYKLFNTPREMAEWVRTSGAVNVIIQIVKDEQSNHWVLFYE